MKSTLKGETYEKFFSSKILAQVGVPSFTIFMKPREITRVGLGALTPRTKNFRSEFLVKITQKHEKQQGSTLGAKNFSIYTYLKLSDRIFV